MKKTLITKFRETASQMGVIHLLGVITLTGLFRGAYHPYNTETPKRKASFTGGFLLFILGIFLAV